MVRVGACVGVLSSVLDRRLQCPGRSSRVRFRQGLCCTDVLYVHEHEIKEEFDCQQSDSRTMSADKGCCVVEHVARGCDRLARRDVH